MKLLVRLYRCSHASVDYRRAVTTAFGRNVAAGVVRSTRLERQSQYPFGQRVSGQLIDDDGGNMSAHVMRDGRPAFEAKDPAAYGGQSFEYLLIWERVH